MNKEEYFNKLRAPGSPLKGKLAWNKGLTKERDKRVLAISIKNKGKKLSAKTKQKISEKAKGRRFSEETRKLLSNKQKGKHYSQKTEFRSGKLHPNWKGGKPKCKICEKRLTNYKSLYCKNHVKSGERAPNWKGGITPLRKSLYFSNEYKIWRSSVFERDLYSCKICGKKGKGLEAHHINKIEQIFKEKRVKCLEEAYSCKELWVVNNGITLCKKCHKLIHKSGNSSIKGHLRICLAKMLSYVNSDFSKINISDIVNPFYLKYSWTEDQQEDFVEWFADYLYNNAEARKEIMNVPIKNKNRCKLAASHFVFNYGWKLLPKGL